MAKIGYYQFRPEFGRVAENLDRVTGALQGVEADLMVLPELPFTGYCFRDRAELEALAEDPRDSPVVDRLTRLCRDRDFHLVTGFAERRPEGCFNSALLLGPEGLVGTYRKIHLFDRETALFDRGDGPLEVTEVRGIRVGIMICFDWIFPEPARVLALRGADVICHPSNLVLDICQHGMLTRCTENFVYAVTVNRFGTEESPEGRLTFTGESQIVAPRGKLLHRGPVEGDDLHVEEVDLERARDKRITGRNDVLGDRRPSFYGPISEGG